jgi:hypothetical protein
LPASAIPGFEAMWAGEFYWLQRAA